MRFMVTQEILDDHDKAAPDRSLNICHEICGTCIINLLTNLRACMSLKISPLTFPHSNLGMNLQKYLKQSSCLSSTNG